MEKSILLSDAILTDLFCFLTKLSYLQRYVMFLSTQRLLKVKLIGLP